MYVVCMSVCTARGKILEWEILVNLANRQFFANILFANQFLELFQLLKYKALFF